MTSVATTKQQILDLLETLNGEQLDDVLDFVRRIPERPQGIPGKELAEFIRGLPESIGPEEAQQMDVILKEIREMDTPRG